ncbi:head-tail connector protein [Vibrio harveyi]
MRDSIRKRCTSIHTELENDFSSWKPHLQEISNFTMPRMQQFNVSQTGKGDKGMNSKILDPSATLYLRTAAGGMFSGITNPTMKWLRLNTSNKDKNKRHAVRVYLDQCSDIILELLGKTNFYNASYMAMKDILAFSTSSVGIQKSEKHFLRFYPNPIGSYRMANGEDLSVSTHETSDRWTAARLVERFGINNVSNAVKSAYNSGNFQQRFEIRHLVFNNPDFIPQAFSAVHKEYCSIWYEVNAEDDKLLSRGGFDTFPFLTPRWEAVGSDVYGSFGPGMIGLGQIKGLQVDQKEKFTGSALKNKPPMVGPTSLKNSISSLAPGGLTFLDNMTDGAGFIPAFQSTFSIQDSLASISDTREILKQVFFYDLFLTVIDVNKSGVTAYEIAQRKEEKMIMLGPVLTRFDEEFLDPTVVTAYHEADRRGLLPDPPQELENEEIEIQYTGLLHQAQKSVGVTSIERSLGFVGNLSAIAPQAMDKVNVDKAVDIYFDITGTTPEVTNDENTIKQIREQRQKDKQAQRLAEMAPAAQQGASAAKLLSDVDMNQNNGLTNMLGVQ